MYLKNQAFALFIANAKDFALEYYAGDFLGCTPATFAEDMQSDSWLPIAVSSRFSAIDTLQEAERKLG